MVNEYCLQTIFHVCIFSFRVKNFTFTPSTAPTTRGKTSPSVCVCVCAASCCLSIHISSLHTFFPASHITPLSALPFPLPDNLTRSIQATSAGVKASTGSCALGSPRAPAPAPTLLLHFFVSPPILSFAAYWQSYSSRWQTSCCSCHLITPDSVNVLFSFVSVGSSGTPAWIRTVE